MVDRGTVPWSGLFFCLVFLCGIWFAAQRTWAADPLVSRTGFFFDTVITVSLYDSADETILDDCFDKMEYYESLFSRTKEGSDLWRINHAGGETVEVSEESAELITKALSYCELSGGLFDITIAPVTDLWDFHEDMPSEIPAQEDIEEALSHVNYENVKVDGCTVTIRDPEAQIDLGAIAKGYISDGIAALLNEKGCRSALIDLGGNIYAVGTKPDGKKFRVGIRRPFGESAMDLAAVVSVSDGCVITSGTYERYFILDDVLYHHILDPGTGYSMNNGLASVSIMASAGTDGDALSTVCFLLGQKKGLELIEDLDGIEAMFIDENGNMICSSGWPQEKN